MNKEIEERSLLNVYDKNGKQIRLGDKVLYNEIVIGTVEWACHDAKKRLCFNTGTVRRPSQHIIFGEMVDGKLITELELISDDEWNEIVSSNFADYLKGEILGILVKDIGWELL